jgi:Mce-associated membrane protein
VTETSAPAAGRAPLSPAARRVAIALAVVGTLLLATSVALALIVKSHVDDEHALENARTDATTAARQEIVNLDSLAWSSIDRDLARVLSGATGTFKDQFSRAQQDLKAQIVQRKSISTGNVVSAAVVRADTDTATVLIAAERTVRDSTTTTGGTAHDRWRVEMEKHGGRWLVADLEPVA